MILTLNDWLNNAAAFQFCFMALAVDVIDRNGPSNEMRRQLQPKETKVRLYYSYLYSSKRCFIRPSLLTRQSASVLKMGVLYE